MSLSPTDLAILGTIVGSIVMFGGAAALALGWAFRNGQFENFDRGARSIFGPDEPIGEPTDSFPRSRDPVSAAGSPEVSPRRDDLRSANEGAV